MLYHVISCYIMGERFEERKFVRHLVSVLPGLTAQCPVDVEEIVQG